MNVCTKLIPLDTGDLTFDETIEEVESGGQVIIATTGRIGVDGKPLVRLVGQPKVLLATLQDGWNMTLDEAQAYLEQ